MTRRTVLVFGLIALVPLGFVPFATETSPAFSITVTLTDGTPMQGVAVSRAVSSVWEYEDYSHTTPSDAQGRVGFPRRAVSLSLFDRAKILIGGLFPHAGWGSTLTDMRLLYANTPATFERLEGCNRSSSPQDFFYAEPRMVVLRIMGVGNDRCYRVILKPNGVRT